MTTTTTTAQSLTRARMSGFGVWLFQIGASSPMAVVAGGIVGTYAATGVIGTPLSFVLLGVALALLAVGYVAMSRHVPHAAPAYALLAHGFGPAAGVVGGALALVSYNLIQISLYGLIGVTLAGLLGGPWIAWALTVWAGIAVCGLLHINLNTAVVGVVLLVELAVIVLLDLAAFTHPAGGSIPTTPMSLDALWAPGIGGVLAFGMAAFVGWDAGPAYSEEVRTRRSVSRATTVAIITMTVLYAGSAWALATAVGTDQIADAARNPDSGLPFSIIDRWYGSGLSILAAMLLVTSVFVAMLAFHNVVARYTFAMARERVLPGWLAYTGGRRGIPAGGSLLQSITALLAVIVFYTAGADPIAVLFTWPSAAAAVGILTILILISAASIRFFRRGGGTSEGVLVTTVIPTIGAAAGVTVLAVTVTNLSSLLGLPPGSPLQWLIPAGLAAVIVAGLIWALTIKAGDHTQFTAIGRGRPNPLAVRDHRLEELDV